MMLTRVRRMPPYQISCGIAVGFGATWLALRSDMSALLQAPAGAKTRVGQVGKVVASAAPPATPPSTPTPSPAEKTAAGLHFEDVVECAQQVAAKINERVALARSKVAAGEEYEKSVGVLWNISVGKKGIFEDHETSQAEFDASCAALLAGGGVGGRGRDMAPLRDVRIFPTDRAVCLP